MSALRQIIDLVTRGIGTEARYRREHPCETEKMFRARATFWSGRGRKVLANIATRRADRWAARCKGKSEITGGSK